jgi:hypothetical protein
LLLSLLSIIIFLAAKVVEEEGGDCWLLIFLLLSPLFRGGVLVLLLPSMTAGYLDGLLLIEAVWW